jgi:hypothetical protein
MNQQSKAIRSYRWRKLSAITFVLDYWQLHFDGPTADADLIRENGDLTSERRLISQAIVRAAGLPGENSGHFSIFLFLRQATNPITLLLH